MDKTRHLPFKMYVRGNIITTIELLELINVMLSPRKTNKLINNGD